MKYVFRFLPTSVKLKVLERNCKKMSDMEKLKSLAELVVSIFKKLALENILPEINSEKTETNEKTC